MMNRGLIRNIVGIIGNIVSLFLFLSPAETFWKIHKAKSVEAFKPDPYVATILNCAMWVFYGLPFVHPDATLVLSTNAVGFVIEMIYIAVFLIYSDWSKRRKIFIILLIEAIFFGIVAGTTLGLLHSTNKRSLIVGIICIILNIVMYFSPLTIMKRVITTKSVKYMPFWLSVTNFLNGGIWTVYALLKLDINVLIANGLGTLSGAIQLILYAIYYRRTQADRGDTEMPPQVELFKGNDKSSNPVLNF